MLLEYVLHQSFIGNNKYIKSNITVKLGALVLSSLDSYFSQHKNNILHECLCSSISTSLEKKIIHAPNYESRVKMIKYLQIRNRLL